MVRIETPDERSRHQPRSGVLVVDDAHRIRLATTAACHLVERSAADLDRAPLSRLFPRHRLPGVVASAMRCCDPDQHIDDVVTTLITRHGQERRVVASVVAPGSRSESLASLYLSPIDHGAATPVHELYRGLVEVVLDGGDQGHLARAVCDRLATMPEFLGTSFVRRDDGTREAEVLAATGCLAGEVGRRVPLADARWRRAWRSGTPMRIVQTRSEVSRRLDDPSIDSIWLAPIRIGDEIEGLVTAVGRSRDRPPRTLMAFITEIASAASLALETSERSRDRSAVALIADHERIARDLHDLVIGRVIATAMHLEAVLGQTDGDLRHRLDTAVDELDIIAREIRSTVFRLHRSDGRLGLADEIRDLTTRIASGFGLRAHCEIRGRHHELPLGLRSTLLAVLREILSNAGRHAHAESVRVEVDLDEGVLLRVIDDGIGPDPIAAADTGEPRDVSVADSSPSPEVPGSHRSGPASSVHVEGVDASLVESRDRPHARGLHGNGLANLRERARELGGDCFVLPRRPHGTEVRWQVPRRMGTPAHRD